MVFPLSRSLWRPFNRVAWKEVHGRRQLGTEETLAVREGEAREVQSLAGLVL